MAVAFFAPARGGGTRNQHPGPARVQVHAAMRLRWIRRPRLDSSRTNRRSPLRADRTLFISRSTCHARRFRSVPRFCGLAQRHLFSPDRVFATTSSPDFFPTFFLFFGTGVHLFCQVILHGPFAIPGGTDDPHPPRARESFAHTGYCAPFAVRIPVLFSDRTSSDLIFLQFF